MSIFTKAGVLLQRTDTSDDAQIMIKLIRVGEHATAPLINAPTLTLHVKDHGNAVHLDFDPWSDINVNADNSIDEQDIDAITQLALAFYRQPIIHSGDGAFLSLGREDLIDLFDPDKPVGPLPPQAIEVNIEVLDMEDHDQPELDYFITALSVDNGARFKIQRIAPHTGPTPVPELDELIQSFIKLKL